VLFRASIAGSLLTSGPNYFRFTTRMFHAFNVFNRLQVFD